MTPEIEFKKLVEIMSRLRKECPWDRRQTPQSLRQYILEEAYETVEAIDNNDWNELKNELGDLLLQIVFQGEIAKEKKRFTLSEVIHHINEKLISRHPHVFGDVKVSNAEEVKENWEQIKIRDEKRKSLLEGVPRNLSGLLRAQRLQDKAAQVGFDWEDVSGILAKIKEEIGEIEAAVRKNNKCDIENELGDLMFSLVNFARFQGINSEDAVRHSINKFVNRFQYIEGKLADENRSVYDSSLVEMDKFWEESKKKV